MTSKETSGSRRPMRSRATIGATIILLAAGALATSGCASSPIPPPILSKAALGRVIIYRNGVAYFERYADASEKELTLRVPAERVDDFLKSLTIMDDKTGETMPVSYPTMSRDGGDVEMTIKLPERHNTLRISYVTESPAWKPSYRVVLGADGKAKLQGWAVVDNISGEDWKHVRIGVGSTSALSFRYDLHSIRLVERETLSSGSLLAVAPPTGGSPYRVKVARKEIVANLAQGAIDDLGDDDGTPDIAKAEPIKGRLATAKAPPRVSGRTGLGGAAANRRPGAARSSYGGRGKASGQQWGGPAADPRPKKPQPVSRRRSQAHQMVATLSSRLRNNRDERVRIEGYARSADKHPRRDSLDRANRVRDALINRGVDPAQLEAIGNGEVNDAQAVRVMSVAEEGRTEGSEKDGKSNKPLEQPPAAVEGEPLGQAHFVSSEALTIERDHSAMVSIINEQTEAQKVYYYDPISARGSKKFAFNAVRIRNPSKYTLDSGPFTVYVKGQFLGEGMAEPILPHSTAFIPYALDRNIIVEPKISGREAIDRLITIQRGVVSTETRSIRTTKLAITNRGQQQAEIYVRHKVAQGYKLSTMGPKMPKPEKLGGAHLFRVNVGAGETLKMTIEEWTPVKRSVDIRTDAGIKAIGLFVKAAKLDAALQRNLREIVKRHNQRANMQERIRTLSEQMAVYRARVDEINVQLVTLRKLRQAAKLRRHLSDKMQEISEKLQAATMELADMKGELMTQQIELQDLLAELTLKDERDKDAADRSKE